MTRKNRQISMAEAAMTMERTFMQPLDISSAMTYEEFMETYRIHARGSSKNIDPELAWELFKAMNLGEAVFNGDPS